MKNETWCFNHETWCVNMIEPGTMVKHDGFLAANIGIYIT